MSVSDLLEKLGLQQQSLPDVNIDLELQTCVAAARWIWAQPDDRNFTIHDVRHSSKIITYFDLLQPYYPSITDAEKFVFFLAALIHDIGMQYNHWADLPVDENSDQYIWQGLNLPQPPLDPDAVRKSHIAHGESLVLAEMSRKRSWVTPPAFTSQSPSALVYLNYALKVAFAHSGGTLWDKCLNPEALEYAARPGDVLRTRLLVGLLRICDELDGNFHRVAAPERLLAASVPDLSKLHWMACYFTEGVTIRAEDRYVDIHMAWRVPEPTDDPLIAAIKDLLFEFRERRIQREIDRVNEMFRITGNHRYVLNARVHGLDEAPSRFPMVLHPRISKLVSNFRQVARVPEQVAEPADAESPAEVPLGIPANAYSAGSQRVQPLGLNVPSRPTAVIPPRANLLAARRPVERVLRDWFNDNRQARHVCLRNGDHTDTYVRCRTLVSDQELMRYLAGEIADRYSEHSIVGVVGVGTSSIPLAVNVAFRLGAKISFTFDRSSQEQARHYEFELRPDIPKTEGSILILDDVISGGRAARDAIQRVRAAATGHPNGEKMTIHHLSLFHLGTREIDPAYKAFCHIPEVYYAESASCRLCTNGDPLFTEKEI